jgi:hypothetical protein
MKPSVNCRFFVPNCSEEETSFYGVGEAYNVGVGSSDNGGDSFVDCGDEIPSIGATVGAALLLFIRFNRHGSHNLFVLGRVLDCLFSVVSQDGCVESGVKVS